MEALPEELPHQCRVHAAGRVCMARPAAAARGAAGAQVPRGAVEGTSRDGEQELGYPGPPPHPAHPAGSD